MTDASGNMQSGPSSVNVSGGVDGASATFSIPALPVGRQSRPTTAGAATASSDKRQARHMHPAASPTSSASSCPHPVGSAAFRDWSVQGTSDDAATSKLSAATLGYHKDPFLHFFVPQPARRAPLIHRGYWARVASVTQIVQEFLTAGEADDAEAHQAQTAAASASGQSSTASSSASSTQTSTSASTISCLLPTAAPSSPHPRHIRKQILSLGAGSDTLYFKLKSCGLAPARYYEIDFPDAMKRKAAIVRRHPELLNVVQQRNVGHSDEEAEGARAAAAKREVDAYTLPDNAGDYAIIGADLRDLQGLERALAAVDIDYTLPTLFLSECVLIYMLPQHSDALIAWSAERFIGGQVFVSYEQIHPHDAFGETMLANLEKRGCSLLGLTTYPDIESLRRRYTEAAGYTHYAGWDMNDMYRFYLQPTSEIRRIERIELFDEFEEWYMIQAHYHISMASREARISEERKEEGEAALNASASDPTVSEETRRRLTLSARIPWSRLGILGRAKAHAISPAQDAASHQQVCITRDGRRIIIAPAERASAPLKPASSTQQPSKGSLRKPVV